VRRLNFVPLALLALVLAGCGGEPASDERLPGDVEEGALVFTEAGCNGCHALRDAGATGGTGPNLDTLRPGYEQAARQVRNGGRGMPAFSLRLTRDQIRDVAAYVATVTGGGLRGAPAAAEFEPDDTTLESCGGDGACLEQAYGNIAFSEGPRAALRRFERAIAKPGPVESNCHRIAHTIGAASLTRAEGDVGAAFAAGSAVCWSGYYHGVVERGFAGVGDDRLTEAARRMCSDATLRSGPTFTLYQCVHGLGHGLMIHTSYDLPKSLATCDRLEQSWDQTACTGGVFMENISSSYGIQSKWLRADDLLYPCRTVAERHKLYCYLMVTSRILPAVDYDFAETSQLCRTSEPRWVATCFQSLGRDASGNSRQNPVRILELCSTAGSMTGECIYGAARDMASNYAGGREAAVLCRQAPVGLRPRCFEGIGTILGDLSRSREAALSGCAEITRRFRADCARGV
jgi:mono/diheme cytochrome c family protein